MVVVLGDTVDSGDAHESAGRPVQYLQNVQGYLAPPITAVFLLGLFWKRINARGRVGPGRRFRVGMIKLTLQTFYGSGEGRIHEPAFFAAIGDFNPYYATGVLFVVSAVIIVAASLATPPPPEEKTKGLTWGAVHHDPAAVGEIKASWDTGNVVMVVLILACVLGMYGYFTFWLD